MDALPVLLVFGASGATGSEVVKQALATGDFKVRAFVRNASKLPKDVTENERLEVFQGDFEDGDKIDAACVGVKYGSFFFVLLFIEEALCLHLSLTDFYSICDCRSHLVRWGQGHVE